MEYEEIYFVGKPGTKKTVSDVTKEEDCNFGYDDDKGDYKIVTGDHVGFRYEVQDFLGKGSFGIAVKCYDHKEKCFVALKVIKNKEKYAY